MLAICVRKPLFTLYIVCLLYSTKENVVGMEFDAVLSEKCFENVAFYELMLICNVLPISGCRFLQYSES